MTGPIRNVLLIALAFAAFNDAARAHFSYSDPRIVHVMERDGDAVVLIRMPAPLPLLPEDWQGADDTRVPPFGMASDDAVVLDPAALFEGNDDLRDVLRDSITLRVDGQQIGNRVERYRFHSDAARPRFGTRKSALAAFDAPYAPSDVAKISYFDLTLDVMIRAPDVRISEDVRLTSSLGHSFRVIEKLGTVVKLHRSEGTETQASLGVLDVSLPRVLSQPWALARAALIGAEHIYRGLDHLAIIVLIAIAAGGLWQALGWASAFTLGHMATLVAGLYGVALGRVFFGESMFNRVDNAAKIALVALVRLLEERGCDVIDCQVESEHLNSMGARNIPRANFERYLVRAPGEEDRVGPWDREFRAGELA